ncbi:hypothetical protein PHEL85_3361 [Polaribacter sp. Hel1_85]|nr:hypothetical protein PHEL85_3361 [Polaribacter sp. Hel1_85]
MDFDSLLSVFNSDLGSCLFSLQEIIKRSKKVSFSILIFLLLPT